MARKELVFLDLLGHYVQEIRGKASDFESGRQSVNNSISRLEGEIASLERDLKLRKMELKVLQDLDGIFSGFEGETLPQGAASNVSRLVPALENGQQGDTVVEVLDDEMDDANADTTGAAGREETATAAKSASDAKARNRPFILGNR